MPIIPIGTHCGAAAGAGESGKEKLICCAEMVLGLRSIAYAGSLGLTGKLPVVWLIGRPLPMTRRSPPVVATVNVALGHATSPWIAIFFVASQVEPWIHSPTCCAPPPRNC